MSRFPAVAGLALSGAAFLLAGPLAAAESAIDSVVRAYADGDFQKAAELAAAVPAADPMRLKAAYVLGESDLVLEKWDDAAKAFQEVLAKKADNVPALVGLGRAQTGKGSATDAVATLEKAVKADPKDAPAKRALGEAQIAAGDAKKGRDSLEAAVKLDPKDPLASRSLVEAMVKGEDLSKALAEAERLAKALPDHPMGWFLKGYVLDRQGKDDDAIEAYEKAIAKDDKFIDAHKDLAILCTTKNPLYQNRERTHKAFEHYAKYFELGGKDEELKGLYEQIKSVLEQYGFK